MAVQYGLKIIPEIRKAIHELSEFIKDYLRENRTFILNYFMKIKDKVNAEEAEVLLRRDIRRHIV